MASLRRCWVAATGRYNLAGGSLDQSLPIGQRLRLGVLIASDRRAQGSVAQQSFKILDGSIEPFGQFRLRRPREKVIGLGNVGTPLSRIVLRPWSVHDMGARTG